MDRTGFNIIGKTQSYGKNLEQPVHSDILLKIVILLSCVYEFSCKCPLQKNSSLSYKCAREARKSFLKINLAFWTCIEPKNPCVGYGFFVIDSW